MERREFMKTVPFMGVAPLAAGADLSGPVSLDAQVERIRDLVLACPELKEFGYHSVHVDSNQPHIALICVMNREDGKFRFQYAMFAVFLMGLEHIHSGKLVSALRRGLRAAKDKFYSHEMYHCVYRDVSYEILVDTEGNLQEYNPDETP